MHTTKSIQPQDQTDFNIKLDRLNELTKFISKVDEAILGEEPQMRKVLKKYKKSAIQEMEVLNLELKKIASVSLKNSAQ